MPLVNGVIRVRFLGSAYTVAPHKYIFLEIQGNTIGRVEFKFERSMTTRHEDLLCYSTVRTRLLKDVTYVTIIY